MIDHPFPMRWSSQFFFLHFLSVAARIDAEICLIKEEKRNLIESGFQVIVGISLCFLV